MTVGRVCDVGVDHETHWGQYTIAFDKGGTFLLSKVVAQGQAHLGLSRTTAVLQKLVRDVDVGVDLASDHFELAKGRLRFSRRLRLTMPSRVGDAGALRIAYRRPADAAHAGDRP